MKIAVVEDNEKLRGELSDFLRRYGYEIYAPARFEAVADELLTSGVHLVLLDINLPCFDGFFICRELRKKSKVPIIMVTSREGVADELTGIGSGADDFITKPYHPQILLARIQALLGRTYGGQSAMLQCGSLSLDLLGGTASAFGREIELTKNELKILALLMKNSPRIISREEIMNALWQSDAFIDDNTLTVNMARLRKKLEGAGLSDMIKTKRGLGYRI